MKNLNLANKTIVITGASGGIGRAAAVAFARRGSVLALSGRNLEALEITASAVREQDAKALIIPADVTREDEVKQLVEQAIEKTGRLDVMMLGAGYAAMGAVENISLGMWRDQIDVNLFGVLHGFYAALPHFLDQGFGQYIIMNSLSGRMAMGLGAPYGASKFALWGFADCARCELARKNIGLLSVYPYFVKTTFQGNIQSKDLHVDPKLAWKMLGQDPDKLGEKIVKACERRKGELLCTPLGWFGPRFTGLSYHLAEGLRRLLLPLTWRVLG